jgi:hypothetical protein
VCGPSFGAIAVNLSFSTSPFYRKLASSPSWLARIPARRRNFNAIEQRLDLGDVKTLDKGMEK